jgi:CBS domain-containing protein
MIINDILKNKDKALYCIHPEESIFNCIKILNSKRFGALIVMSPNEELLGIITERDILRLTYETRGQIQDVPVKDVMTPSEDVTTASTTDDINIAMEIMTNKKVRHLPIVNDGKLQGIIAIGEVVEALWHKALKELSELKDNS